MFLHMSKIKKKLRNFCCFMRMTLKHKWGAEEKIKIEGIEKMSG